MVISHKLKFDATVKAVIIYSRLPVWGHRSTRRTISRNVLAQLVWLQCSAEGSCKRHWSTG